MPRKRKPGTVDPALNEQIRLMTAFGVISPKKAAQIRKQAKLMSLLNNNQPPAAKPEPPSQDMVPLPPGVEIGG